MPHSSSRSRALLVAPIVVGGLLAVAGAVGAVASLLPYPGDGWWRLAQAMAWVELALALALIPVLVLIKIRRQKRNQKERARRRALEEAVSAEDHATALSHARQWPEEFLEVTQEAVVSLRGMARDQFWQLVTESGPSRS
ncbi:MAG: hypothetical protein NTV70_07825 [Acidobacteria bacterium]|nr:hypothetical protein [Acidobacteriota bacterium]